MADNKRNSKNSNMKKIGELPQIEKTREDIKEKKEEISKKELAKKSKSILNKFSSPALRRVFLSALFLFGMGMTEQLGRMSTLRQALAPDQTRVPENISARKNFERVKSQCVLLVGLNENLKKEIGEESIEKLIKAINEMKFNQIDTLLSEISGVPIDSLEREKTALIYLISDAERKNPAQISKQFKGDKIESNLLGMCSMKDEIFLIVEPFINDEGEIDIEGLQETITHEYLHVLTTVLHYHSKVYNKEVQLVPWTVDYNMPDVFYEGATEYIATIVSAQQGIKRSKGYELGTLAAHYIAQAVGKEVFVRDYLNCSIGEIEAKFDEKFGAGAFKDLTQGDPMIDLMSANREVQRRFLVRLNKILIKNNFDFKTADRSALGLDIAIDYITKNEDGTYDVSLYLADEEETISIEIHHE